MRIDLLKQLLVVPSLSHHEQALVAFIAEHVRRRGAERCGHLVTDKHNNVYIRKGKPGIVPGVAAHLDTVHEPGMVKIVRKAGRLFGLNKQCERVGIGADDRVGVFICLELLEKFDDIAVILFAAEEIGCVGAQNAPEAWFQDLGYVIEFDCPGKGLVSYTSNGVRLFANDGPFIQTAAPVLEAHGLTRWRHHPFSDVMALRRRFQFSCLNLSCGYYNGRQPDEFVVVTEVEAALKAGAALIAALANRAYPFTGETKGEAAPLYPVTGLQVSPLEPKPVVIEPPGTTTWMICPQDIDLFALPILSRLHQRPFHIVHLYGTLDVKKLIHDYRQQVYRTERTHDSDEKSHINQLLLLLDDGIFVHWNSRKLTVYAPTHGQAHQIAKSMKPYLQAKSEMAGFWIVSINSGCPDATLIEVKREAPITDVDLRLNYGDEILEWEQAWIERLRECNSGVSLLFGPPGTGKTSYLRGLMKRLSDSFGFYYIPANAFSLLTDPAFTSFWVDQQKHADCKHRIAIMEDAESLLLPRDEHSQSSVSNLLNISDGFLGDFLNLQVICTTNAHFRELDPATRRPARLMGAREFRRLSRADADRLAKAKGLSVPNKADFSLAELYCGANEGQPLQVEHSIGFAQ